MDDLLARARAYARKYHEGQRYGDVPYVRHLEAVERVLRSFDVDDPEILVAGWLHDVLEDTPATRAELKAYFGERVADLVWAVTDGHGANRRTRKQDAYRKMQAQPEAIDVKLADRIANVETALERRREGLLRMYTRGHARFETALRGAGGRPGMWAHLGALVEGRDPEFRSRPQPPGRSVGG